MYEDKPHHPLYGPWLIGTRPKKSAPMGMSGGMEKIMNITERSPRRTWFDIMNEVCDLSKRNKEEMSKNGGSAEAGSM